MILNLSPNFKPFPQKQALLFDALTFSGGEPHIKLKSDLSQVDEILVTHRINSFNDLGLFLMAIDALRRSSVKNISAFIPYFPGARQDRVMVPGEPLSVKVYADIINQAGLKEIMIFDPHSEVTTALLNNCRVLSNHSFIASFINRLPENTMLVSPDGGALKKIHDLATFLGKYEIVECSKIRNVCTGELSGFNVHSENLYNRPCLIVDDICDGGGTFVGLAEQLKNKNAGALHLAISHGIFSKGIEKLKPSFTEVYTTDSIRNLPEDPFLTQIPLSTIIK